MGSIKDEFEEYEREAEQGRQDQRRRAWTPEEASRYLDSLIDKTPERLPADCSPTFWDVFVAITLWGLIVAAFCFSWPLGVASLIVLPQLARSAK